MPHTVSRAAVSLLALALVACGNEDESNPSANRDAGVSASARPSAQYGSVDWTLDGESIVMGVDTALANSSTPGLYAVRIDANPPDGAPTRHGPVLSRSFQLIPTGSSSTTRTAVLSFDPRGPGTGWWSGRAGSESQIRLNIENADVTNGRLTLSGRITGQLISRADNGATTAPVDARFSIETEVNG